jgi:NAD(P)-dependent dehydrogenase (short-subunit alcohol dehydrogenase family)
MSTKNLLGKGALVTGAGRGLGKAIALALAGAGARLALVSRSEGQLQAVAQEVKALGSEAEVFVADVSAEDQVRQLASDVSARFGKVQILVNNAGTNIRKPLTEFSLAEWNQVVDTNLTSVFLMCRAFVPQMKGQGYGRIINMASVQSHAALPERTPYGSSKAGMLGLSKALALELAADAITVNCICPGPFHTELTRPIYEDPQRNQQFLSCLPVGRWGRVEEIGQLALHLCSEASGFITGTDILIDGGWAAQ